MLIDNVTIKVTAGKGGDGAATFNKMKMALGPTGGSGGKGFSRSVDELRGRTARKPEGKTRLDGDHAND